MMCINCNHYYAMHDSAYCDYCSPMFDNMRKQQFYSQTIYNDERIINMAFPGLLEFIDKRIDERIPPIVKKVFVPEMIEEEYDKETGGKIHKCSIDLDSSVKIEGTTTGWLLTHNNDSMYVKYCPFCGIKL